MTRAAILERLGTLSDRLWARLEYATSATYTSTEYTERERLLAALKRAK